MGTYSVRCGKCTATCAKDADDVFNFMAILRLQGWQIPDAIENQPILCPKCRTAANQP